MWIVQLALRRPYTVAVLCLIIALMGGLSIQRMRVDVLPAIDIPVVIAVWNFTGLSAEEMEKRVTFLAERAYSTTVNGISRIESQSISGTSIVKVYFQDGTDIGEALSQINAVSNTVLRAMPPGITPPAILRFNASNVPVAQLTVSGEKNSEQELFDFGLNFLRLRLFTVKGLATPAPYGGASRQIMVDVDPARLAAKRLAPQDVVNAVLQSNVLLPSGTARLGLTDYDVVLNSSPDKIKDFNTIPLKVVNGATVLLGDVANVRDGSAVQTNVVRVNGRRATYLVILKKSDASTLAVVDATKELLPTLKAIAPEGVNIKLEFDQSVFVRAAVVGVLREALIAAFLVSVMILFFLGSWRSTVLVGLSIPLAILVGVCGLFLTGQTLNLMTLGGLSLAVGMLVDDATVEVENIHRNRLMGKPLTIAILDGAHQIAVPALAATLTICIVFFPVLLLEGPSRFLFTPLALSVVFSMMASYLLSRTLVPSLARKLMAKEALHGVNEQHEDGEHAEGKQQQQDPADGIAERNALEGAQRGQSQDPAGQNAPQPGERRAQDGSAPRDARPEENQAQAREGASADSSSETTQPGQPPPQDAQRVKTTSDRSEAPGRSRPGDAVAATGGATAPAEARSRRRGAAAEGGPPTPDSWQRFNEWRDHHFGRFQRRYEQALVIALDRPGLTLVGAGLMVLCALALLPIVGLDFFPRVDTGQMRLHFRAPTGVRIEETERWVQAVEDRIRRVIPADELSTINDNIGVPLYYNLGFVQTDNVAGSDADILVELKEHHRPTDSYMNKLRQVLPEEFPGGSFYFQPADVVTQVLNFGLPAPVDIQISGRDPYKSHAIATKLLDKVRRVPGVVDVRIPQVFNKPTLRVDVDRQRAALLGLTERDVANNLLTSLSSSVLVAPNFWVNPGNSVNYSVAVQTPITEFHNISDLMATPLTSGSSALDSNSVVTATIPGSTDAPYLGAISEIKPVQMRASATHYTVQNLVEVQADVDGRDLGAVSSDITKLIKEAKKELPAGGDIVLRGQSESMYSSFQSLGIGLVLAIVLVYLLMVVLFQSYLDPFIIMVAVPGAMVGILWMLTLTGTTLNVSSFMGAIMAVGIAVSNSILLVSFANEVRTDKKVDSKTAARLAGKTRLRPVLMTALAMVLGMLPMALGMGEGGEQNAPLGRSVIGGLLVATFVTLFIVPVVYSKLRTEEPTKDKLDAEFEKASQAPSSHKSIGDLETSEG